MSSSTKREALHLGEEDASQDTAYDLDARLAKKGKQECVPSDAGRHNLPTTTREPNPI